MAEHNHLCKTCGTILYNATGCNESAEDHRIAGLCDACWAELGTVRRSLIKRKLVSMFVTCSISATMDTQLREMVLKMIASIPRPVYCYIRDRLEPPRVAVP